MKKIASVAGWMAALMVACCPCTAEMSVQDVYKRQAVFSRYSFLKPKGSLLEGAVSEAD